jgi:lysophospholipase L1-like esterase
MRLSLIVSVLLLMFCSVAASARTIYIVPVGDSITQGGRKDRPDELTYRYPLFCMLKDAGVDFKFEGSMTTGLDGGFKWPDYKGTPFDLHHEGHYGQTTQQVHDVLAKALPAYPAAPDIVLIHLGTNDQGAKDYTKAVVDPLTDMVKMLRARNPHVVVLIGHLNFNDGNALKIRPLVEEMAKTLSTKESPIITVHHYQGWHENPKDKDTDTYDWAHPNPKGQKKMAENWYAAMKPYLKLLAGQADTQPTTQKSPKK